jgi:CheY-like chemotaxis protein
VIADNGPGFPPEILARVFEPYVTTKARGTGLGLAIVKKIVDEHQGTIASAMPRGRGAGQHPPAAGEGRGSQHGKILVVDDEVGIRELLSEILDRRGHDIGSPRTPRGARIRGELRPDLVLLDIWMPDTDGISLLKEWSANGLLNMPVVMMSGHGTIDTAVEATRIGAIDFLEKPIALQKLLATVQKALKHDAPPQHPPLTLEAFGRSAFVKESLPLPDQSAHWARPAGTANY